MTLSPTHSLASSSTKNEATVTPKVQKSAHRLKGQETPAKTRLTRPFRSPFSPRSNTTTDSISTGPSSSTNQSVLQSARSERQALETRLLTLQQTEKYLREDSLRSMPGLIRKWRQAGQSAAHDLWQLTGANAGDFVNLATSKGDYGLESQPFSQPDSQDRKRKIRDSASPISQGGPMLERRPRKMSAGDEEVANSLRGQPYDMTAYRSSDTSSQSSLPDAAEILRRSQKLLKRSKAPAPTPRVDSWMSKAIESPTTLSTIADNEAPRSWNVGRMLDMLGADKSILGWDAEEEEFLTQDAVS